MLSNEDKVEDRQKDERGRRKLKKKTPLYQKTNLSRQFANSQTSVLSKRQSLCLILTANMVQNCNCKKMFHLSLLVRSARHQVTVTSHPRGLSSRFDRQDGELRYVCSVINSSQLYWGPHWDYRNAVGPPLSRSNIAMIKHEAWEIYSRSVPAQIIKARSSCLTPPAVRWLTVRMCRVIFRF